MGNIIVNSFIEATYRYVCTACGRKYSCSVVYTSTRYLRELGPLDWPPPPPFPWIFFSIHAPCNRSLVKAKFQHCVVLCYFRLRMHSFATSEYKNLKNFPGEHAPGPPYKATARAYGARPPVPGGSMEFR